MDLPVRKKNRKKGYDYSAGGGYFVTICTDDRLHHFGEIVDGVMVLNTVGMIAQQAWIQIPDYYDDHVDCDAFVIMPNHIHGIIITDGSGPSVSTIIKSYKGYCSKQIRPYIPNFTRQKTFYDRIIRNQEEYERIVYYIQTNPENREQDPQNT